MNVCTGPPTSPTLSDEQLTKRIKLSETESPLVPTLSASTSPGQQTRVDIYNTADPFLGVGRGGDVPPQGRESSPQGRESSPRGRESSPRGRESSPRGRESSPRGRESPPPLPAKLHRPVAAVPAATVGEIEEEEKALLSELDELAKMVAPPNGELSQYVLIVV